MSSTTWIISTVTSSAHSLKHTPKNGPHRPVESSLLAGRLTELFRDKAMIRVGEILKVEPCNINENSVYFELHSQTTSTVNGMENKIYREIGATISKDGQCKVEHFLEHYDEERYNTRKGSLENNGNCIVIQILDK